MATAAAQMTQVNLRIDAHDKQQAEEVLHLMGTTATSLVRKLYAKVACGAKDYAEVMAVLDGPKAEAGPLEAGVNPVLLEGCAMVDEFFRSLGCESAEDLPIDTRSFDEVYEEAMVEHYREKGWLS